MTRRSAVAAEPTVGGLEDLSGETRALRVLGRDAAAWLSGNGLPCPEALFGVQRSGSDADAILVARVGAADVVVQGSATNPMLDSVGRALDETREVFQVPEQATTLRLSGPRAEGALRQTCAVPLATEPLDRVVYTRMAGISCAVIPESHSGERSYRIWVDYSYAKALWQSLGEILSG